MNALLKIAQALHRVEKITTIEESTVAFLPTQDHVQPPRVVAHKENSGLKGQNPFTRQDIILEN